MMAVGNSCEDCSEMTVSELIITPAAIDAFCEHLSARGRRSETVSAYRRSLLMLHGMLPADKALTEESIHTYLSFVQKRYPSPRTLNHHISCMNSFLQYSGRRDLSVSHRLLDPEEHLPELTRQEYYRLLQAAKLRGDDKLYFLIKVFATVGLSVQDLPGLTLETLQDGRLTSVSGETSLSIPDCLRYELLDYCAENGIRSGAVFLDGKGNPIHRTGVTAAMKRLSRDARVAEEKANPRCLKKLCLRTRDAIIAEMMLLAERGYERFLETEQPIYGWRSSSTSPEDKQTVTGGIGWL